MLATRAETGPPLPPSASGPSPPRILRSALETHWRRTETPSGGFPPEAVVVDRARRLGAGLFRQVGPPQSALDLGGRAGEPSEARSGRESGALGTSGPTRRRCWWARSVLEGATTAARAKSSRSRARGGKARWAARDARASCARRRGRRFFVAIQSRAALRSRPVARVEVDRLDSGAHGVPRSECRMAQGSRRTSLCGRCARARGLRRGSKGRADGVFRG